MQPGLIVGLALLALSWAVVARLTRHELRPGHPGPFNRPRFAAGLLLVAALLSVTLARQRSAWQALESLSLPLPADATHLVGWPPLQTDSSRTWVVRLRRSFADTRRFYVDEAPRRGWTVGDSIGDVALMLFRADTIAMVGSASDRRPGVLVVAVSRRSR